MAGVNCGLWREGEELGADAVEEGWVVAAGEVCAAYAACKEYVAAYEPVALGIVEHY